MVIIKSNFGVKIVLVITFVFLLGCFLGGMAVIRNYEIQSSMKEEMPQQTNFVEETEKHNSVKQQTSSPNEEINSISISKDYEVEKVGNNYVEVRTILPLRRKKYMCPILQKVELSKNQYIYLISIEGQKMFVE